MEVSRRSLNLRTRFSRIALLATLATTAVAAEAWGAPKLGKAAAYKTLTRNAHPLARADHEIGRLDPNRQLYNLSIVFKPSAAQVADREALLTSIQDPSSPNYHHWLTTQEYAARFGAKPADIAKMTAWLASQGLQVGAVSPLGTRVHFGANVAQFEQAFKTEMHQYQYGTETHYAMAMAPSMPASIADLVLSIHDAHDFYAKPAGHIVPAPMAACTGLNACTNGVLGPTDWANLYDVTPLYTTGVGGKAITGTGVTIGIVGVAEIAQSDITAFHTAYPPAAQTVTQVLVPNTGVAQGDNGAGAEAILDVEWAGGIAKGANINFYLAGANSGDPDEAAAYAIEENVVSIISESFGGGECGTPPSEADWVQVNGSAAALLGITYLAASGDSGATTCERDGIPGLYVSLPAAYPGITAVGGTQFGSVTGNVDKPTETNNLTFKGTPVTVTAYPTAANAETPWRELIDPNGEYGLGSGGGGISTLFTEPSYQGSLSCTPVGTLPPGTPATGMRLVPDVAFAAASGLPGYVIECAVDTSSQPDCTGVGGTPIVMQYGGTSASTPSFAGVMALVVEATGGARLGNINPILYQLFGASNAAGIFHDLTTGSNEIECTSGTDQGCPSSGGLYGYAAKAGYDCASGLGSADVNKLVTAWAALTATTTTITPSPTTTSEGATVNLTANVTATTGTPTGTVTFAFQSYSANGAFDLTWNLGSATIASGTASLSTAIPPGLVDPSAQYVDVIAEYGGDSTHLASTSTLSRITFATPAFCITPGISTTTNGGKIAFKSAGGIGNTTWYIDYPDTTCAEDGGGCSTIDDAGNFTAGIAQPGWVLVEAFDQDWAETYSEITVGSPVISSTNLPAWADDAGVVPSVCGAVTPIPDGGSKDSGGGTGPGTDGGGVGPTPGEDGGNPPPYNDDGGQPPSYDAGNNDSGETNPGDHPSSSSGCGCTSAPTSNSPVAPIAGLMLALGLISRRRRSS